MTSGHAGLVSAVRLDELCAEARASERKRAHLLLHAGHDDQVQRLLIAVEPGTYVRAHRHSEQWEMLVLLRGSFDVLLLSDGGELLQRVGLRPQAPVVQIPIGHCHCAVALETGTLVMEIKPGPYRPNEFMDWAPEEGSAAASGFVSWANRTDVGRTWHDAGDRR